MSVDVNGLHVWIGSRSIVRDVNMHVANGERVGLVGASGSGKSMIAKTLLGLLPFDARCEGKAKIGQTQIIGASERTLADLRGRYVGAVFQNPAAALNPVLPVIRQIELPLKLHYDLSAAERESRAIAMLHKVGLDDTTAHAYPHQLSGGQQQRVGIATALVTSPRFIIADEPTTALDSITQRQIVDLLVSLVDDAGASMLFITHDFAVLARATSRAYVLDGGAIVESGDTSALLTHPEHEQTRALVRSACALTLHTGIATDMGTVTDGATATDDNADACPASYGTAADGATSGVADGAAPDVAISDVAAPDVADAGGASGIEEGDVHERA